MAERIETPTVDGHRLGVEFIRQADRYRHTILLIQDDSARPLLSSLEGIAADQWPPSPVLQQLHLETRATPPGEASTTLKRRVGLLVGMAGRSHWSLSIEPALDAAALLFDVACRIRAGESPALRSSYHLSAVAQDGVREPGTFLIDEKKLLLTVRAEDHAELQSHTGNDSVCVVAQQVTGLTWRWKYRVELKRQLKTF